MSEFKIRDPEDEVEQAPPAATGTGSFAIRDPEDVRPPSKGAAASVQTSKALEEYEQRKAQEKEESRLRAEKLGETGKQVLSGTGAAANTLTFGFFPYIPAALAKGAGKLGVPGYEYAADMPMMDLKKKAEGIVTQAEEEYPKTSYAGTAAGLGLGAATLPTFKVPGLKETAARTGLATGAVYGGLGGLSQNMDPREALTGSVVGGAGGALLSPVIEKFASKLVTSLGGKHNVLDDNGNLSFSAVKAAKAAGFTDDEITALTPQLKEVMGLRGPTKEAARAARFAEFGIEPTPGMVGKAEGQIAKEAQYGAPSFERIQNEAADAAAQAVGGNKPTLRDAITAAVEKAGKNAADLKKQVNEAYEKAADVPGKFDLGAISNLGDRLRSRWALDPKSLDLYTNDVARNAAKELDSVLGAKIPVEGGSITHQTFNAVESGRKILNNAYGSATTNADRAAIRKLIDDFDNHIESSINSGAFSGDKAVLDQWKEARKLYSQYQNKFGVKKTGEEAGSLLKTIIEGNKSADDVANMMFNFANSGDATMKATAFKTMAQLRRALGPNSPELDNIKNSFIQHMMTPTGDVSTQGVKVFENTAKQINGLLNGRSQGVANRLFTSEERAMLQRYAKVMQEASSDGLTPKTVAKFNQLMDIAKLATPAIISGVGQALGYFHPVLATVVGAPLAYKAAAKTYEALPSVASKAANAPIKGAPVPVPSARIVAPLGINEYRDRQPEAPPTEITDEVRKASGRDAQRKREGRKTGGRVGGSHETEAERLISMLDKVHKTNQKSTKPLLNADDTSVAKALEIAQRHI